MSANSETTGPFPGDRSSEERIAVIGLGFVGLPVAVAFARTHAHVVGYDVSATRIDELRRHHDRTNEIDTEVLADSRLRLTSDPADMAGCSMFIITVPTPLTDTDRPDLTLLVDACEVVGRHLGKRAIVVIESTVYPGATEEICGPVLETASGLTIGEDVTLGYSPERINPGDKTHRLESVTKVVSGQDPTTLNRLARAYGSIIDAGLYIAPSIKVAEAAKVIENVQRDVNIALMNELALIFDKLDISTRDVLAAAGTKWNFLPFSPGLVGGHCIGIDSYYLMEKAAAVGHHCEVIPSGRRINDSIGLFVARKLVKLMIDAGKALGGARVAVLGLTFKENIPDIRNSRVPDIVSELKAFGLTPLVHDPNCDPEEAVAKVGIEICDKAELLDLDAVILAVPHRQYMESVDFLHEMLNPGSVVVDVRSVLDRDALRKDLFYWSL